ncbi:GNAT family N-acetyltransferase [Granulicella sibirica]|uniref:N-acetyltransferase domain-containing protein n=1 Tax=Granulicella sibirica TaxID=2479048 RepID=A0A4Q0T2C9_9BACT|nr:GNAT family N-acetyltransferase [Granulicella sibirica]RXH56992.1 hypothetical protein GRAN_0302 [Granulicella sibirica]
MIDLTYRTARPSDIAGMASLRAQTWGTEDYWQSRIRGYMDGTINPQHALPSRTLFVAMVGDEVIGLIGGHLTQRFDCEGELEWIDVAPAHRGSGVASALFLELGEWFVRQDAKRVCVNVEPTNHAALRFYRKHGSETLNEHWQVWPDIGASLSALRPL